LTSFKYTCKLLKKVKERFSRLFLPSNHRVVLLWSTQALAFIELPVDNGISFNLTILSKTCCGKIAETAKNSHSLKIVSVFQRSVTNSRVAREAHRTITITTGL
jgi:hypothetical protein